MIHVWAATGAMFLSFAFGVILVYLEARKEWHRLGQRLRLISSMLASPVERDYAALRLREIADHLTGEK